MNENNPIIEATELPKYSDLSIREAHWLYNLFGDYSKLKKTKEGEYYIEIDAVVNKRILSNLEKMGYGYVVGDSFTAKDKLFEFTHAVRMFENPPTAASGLLVGPTDINGRPGIKAVLPDGQRLKIGGGEIIMSEKASTDNCGELSRMNVEAGAEPFPCELAGVANTDRASGGMPADEYYERSCAGGGKIPDRYKEMGFTHVGHMLDSNKPEKKWMVLAQKGDQYKVVHGGQKGMEDFSQHKDEVRRKRFWRRMGGEDSEYTRDPFSPLYWHKKYGTWEGGGMPAESTSDKLARLKRDLLALEVRGDGDTQQAKVLKRQILFLKTQQMKDFIKLPSVGSAYNPNTKMVYPVYKNGSIDMENGSPINEVSEEWKNALSESDRDVVYPTAAGGLETQKTNIMEHYYLKVGNIIKEHHAGAPAYAYEIVSFKKNVDGYMVAMVKEHSVTPGRPSVPFEILLSAIVDYMDLKHYTVEGCTYETDRDKLLLKNEIAGIIASEDAKELGDTIVATNERAAATEAELGSVKEESETLKSQMNDTIKGVEALAGGGSAPDEYGFKKNRRNEWTHKSDKYIAVIKYLPDTAYPNRHSKDYDLSVWDATRAYKNPDSLLSVKFFPSYEKAAKFFNKKYGNKMSASGGAWAGKNLVWDFDQDGDLSADGVANEDGFKNKYKIVAVGNGTKYVLKVNGTKKYKGSPADCKIKANLIDRKVKTSAASGGKKAGWNAPKLTTEQYKWGKLRRVEFGSSGQAIIHPEEWEKIMALKSPGTKFSFKDEQGITWNVNRLHGSTYWFEASGSHGLSGKVDLSESSAAGGKKSRPVKGNKSPAMLKEQKKLMKQYAKLTGHNYPPFTWKPTDYTVGGWKKLIKDAGKMKKGDDVYFVEGQTKISAKIVKPGSKKTTVEFKQNKDGYMIGDQLEVETSNLHKK